MPLTGRMQRRWRVVVFQRANPVCGPSTTRTIMAPISKIPRATKYASLVTQRLSIVVAMGIGFPSLLCSTWERGRIVPLLAFAVLTSACADPMPKLADGLPRSFGPTSNFDTRLKEQFPVGSSEPQLMEELRREKFVLRDGGDPEKKYQFASIYDRHALPCREVWTVLWSAELGRITAIAGRDSGDLCL